MADYLDERFRALQAFMKQQNLAGILFLRPIRGGFDLWLTGKTAADPQTDFLSKAFLAIQSTPIVFSINTDKLIEEGEDDPLTTHATETLPKTGYYTDLVGYRGDFFKRMLAENPRLGLVNPGGLLVKVHDFILKYAPQTEFVDVTRELLLRKARKSQEEIAVLRGDVRDLERVMTAVGVNARPGVTERELAYAIRKNLLERGASGWDYSTHCLDVKITSSKDGGEKEAGPFVYPGCRLDLGDRVNLFVNAAMSRGYHVSIARTCILGQACAESKACWDLAVRAEDRAAELLKPGVTIRQIVDAVNEDVILPAGLPADTGNWIYGTGNDWAEYPMAVPGWDNVPLEAGMVLSVGPRIQPEHKEPYCCRDIYEVTQDGGRRLGTLDRELKELFNTHF